MDPSTTLLAGAAPGGAIIFFLVRANRLWQDGGKQLKRPEQIKKENADRMKKAQEDAAKGTRQRRQALLFWLIVLVIVGALLLMLISFRTTA